VLLRPEDIEWRQASGNYIRVHLGEMVYLLRQSLRNLQALLDPSHFLRVHRNVVVNLDHAEEFYLPDEGNMFVRLKSGLCLPLRKANRALLRKILKRPFMARTQDEGRGNRVAQHCRPLFLDCCLCRSRQPCHCSLFDGL
jgi:LytTr DNA-binding domain